MNLCTSVLFSILASANHHDTQCTDPEFCGNHAVSEPVRSCTEGFTFSEAKNCCIMEQIYEPLFQCPYGGELDMNGLCVCESHPRVSCPPDFNYEKFDNVCVRSNLVPMVPSCAHRPDLAGTLSEDGRQCRYTKSFPPRERCPKGSAKRGDTCVEFVSLPNDRNLDYSCPDGWAFDEENKECFVAEQVSCKAVKTKQPKCHADMLCDYQQFMPCDDCVVQKDKHRKLCDGCKAKIEPEVICQAAACKMKVKEKPSKEKTFVEPVACERTTVLPAKPVCASGQYNHGKGSCCEERVVPHDLICAGKSDGRGGCGKDMHYLSDYVCPAPFAVSCGHRDNRGKKKAHDSKSKKTAHPSHCECVTMDYADVIQVCGEDELFNEDTGRCFTAHPPTPYCPEKNARLVNGQCIRVDTEPVRLEYTVTYVTEEPCEMDDCIRDKVAVKKRKVSHKEVHVKKGKTWTKCHDGPCVNVAGQAVVEVPVATDELVVMP